MATTYTPILRLELSPLLTSAARANLLKIDALGRGILTDAEGNTLLRSSEDISLLPQDASVGGSGIGGSINLGSPSQELSSVTSYSASTRIQGTLDLADQAVGGANYLKLSYLSTQDGSVEAADRALTLDVGSGNRAVTINSDLEVNSGSVQVGANTFTLPGASDTLVGAAAAATLTNKSIDADLNTITDIRNANVAAGAGIEYSKLNLLNSVTPGDLSPSFVLPYANLDLTDSIMNSDISSAAAISYDKLELTGEIELLDLHAGFILPYNKTNLSNSIVDADVATGAAIAGTKISPDFGTQPVKTSGGFDVSNGGFETRISASGSQASDLTLILPTTLPLVNEVLAGTATPGVLDWVAAGTGTVTSVALAVDTEGDAIFDVSGSPITTSGTLLLSLATQPAGTVLAGPLTGPDAKPTFRVIDAGDVAGSVEAAQDAVGAMVANSSSVSLTYVDATPSLTAALINTAVSPGSFGTTSAVGSFTVDAQGRLTAASNTSIAITSAAVTDFTEAAQDATGAMVANSSNVTLSYVDATPSLTADLTNTAATPGSFGSASAVATYTVDAKGRLTASGQTTISITISQISDAGLANGAATLDGTGKVPAAQLPSYVDDVLEYANLAAFPVTGEAGKIYVALDTNKTYRWTGSVYVEVSPGDVASVNGLIGIVVLSASSTWTTGTSFNFAHNLGSSDVQVQIRDLADNQIIWVDTVINTDSNTTDLTSSVAPSGSGWRVTVQR